MNRRYLASLLASLLVLAACVVMPALAGSGRGTLYTVSSLGGSPAGYRLTVSSTTGVQVGDHVLALASGGGSGVYLVTATTSTTIDVTDSLTEGGDPGAPVAGGANTTFAWSTPTSGGYTLVPDGAINLAACAFRRNAALASAGTAAPQNANRVFAGPSSGGASAPTFRALVAADLPDVSATYVPTTRTITATSPVRIDGGASADLSTNRTLSLLTVPVGTGGTGLTASGSAGNVLSSDGSAWVSSSISAVLDRGIGSTRGAILYRGASGWAILGPGTSGYALESGGAGADPSYQAIATTLAGLTDATITTPAGSDLLSYNSGTGKWINRTTSAQLDNLSSTQGAVLYRSASGWVALGPGTNGQVLTTGGAAANPSWTTPATTPTWSSVLGAGTSSGGHDPTLTSGDSLRGASGTTGGTLALLGGTATGGTGGAVTIAGAPGGSSGNRAGGSLTMAGGAGLGSSGGGAASLTGGAAPGAGTGGAVSITGGTSTVTSPGTGTGGAVHIAGGAITSSPGGVSGGSVDITGGAGGNSGAGAVTITGGAGFAGQQGGDATISGGTGNNGSTGGGLIICEHGDGSGTNGRVLILSGGNGADVEIANDLLVASQTVTVTKTLILQQSVQNGTTTTKVVPDASATGVFTVDVSTNHACGVRIDACVEATDGTNYQASLQTVYITFCNKAGTLTADTPQYPAAGAGNSSRLTSGTLTADWTVSISGTTATVKINADSSLSAPTDTVSYAVTALGPSSCISITPQ